ncbi:MAG TPA: hypothetical protein VGB52_06525 [Actinomycetota bacterium]
MPSASILLLSGVAVATVLGALAWRRHRGPRSAVKSMDEFRGAMRAIQPRTGKRRH